MVLQHNCLVLCQKSRLFLFDNLAHAGFFHLLSGFYLDLQITLSLEHSKLLLPKALDFSFVFLLAHPAFLSIHLFETLILGEALEQLLFKFVLHSKLLRMTFSL